MFQIQVQPKYSVFKFANRVLKLKCLNHSFGKLRLDVQRMKIIDIYFLKQLIIILSENCYSDSDCYVYGYDQICYHNVCTDRETANWVDEKWDAN